HEPAVKRTVGLGQVASAAEQQGSEAVGGAVGGSPLVMSFDALGHEAAGDVAGNQPGAAGRSSGDPTTHPDPLAHGRSEKGNGRGAGGAQFESATIGSDIGPGPERGLDRIRDEGDHIVEESGTRWGQTVVGSL